MDITTKSKGKYTYIDEGKGETLMLLHGLFGALSNWEGVVNYFRKEYRVIIPMLPIYTMPVRQAGLGKLNEFVEKFVIDMHLNNLTVIGNSLGGHIALKYTLNNTSQVKKLVLVGSSGLFEDSMGGSFPKRGSYSYVEEKVKYTFFDPNVATQELIDEVFEATNDIQKCLRIVAIAKSAQRNNMANEITKINSPTLLVWGLNDTITPPMVAHEFNRLLPNSILKFIDNCCHAPMMEQQEIFNSYLEQFLKTKS